MAQQKYMCGWVCKESFKVKYQSVDIAEKYECLCLYIYKHTYTYIRVYIYIYI